MKSYAVSMGMKQEQELNSQIISLLMQQHRPFFISFPEKEEGEKKRKFKINCIPVSFAAPVVT